MHKVTGRFKFQFSFLFSFNFFLSFFFIFCHIKEFNLQNIQWHKKVRMFKCQELCKTLGKKKKLYSNIKTTDLTHISSRMQYNILSTILNFFDENEKFLHQRYTLTGFLDLNMLLFLGQILAMEHLARSGR